MMSRLTDWIIAVDSPTQTFRDWDWDLPRTGLGWLAVLLLCVLYLSYVCWLYVKDTRMMHPFWRMWLLTLRLGVLAALLVIAFNPQLRTQDLQYHPSKVGVLLDTSLSMRFPAEDSEEGAVANSQAAETRAQAAKRLIFDSPLIAELRKDHEVSVFLFDSELRGPVHIFPSEHALAVKHRGPPTAAGADEPADRQPPPDWQALLQPTGTETRLPETLNSALGKLGNNVAGLLVVSDGASNAGLQVSSANRAARDRNARLVAIGLGGTRKPVNLTVASLQGPALVRISDEPNEKNDTFELVTLVQGEGLKGRTVEVRLLFREKDAGDSEPVELEKREITFAEDLERFELKFVREPTLEGREEYIIRATPVLKVGEINEDDNEARRTVEVTRKKSQILLVAGGPMRDYHFLRNMLARRSGLEMDVWLQTVEANVAGAVDQDARDLLTEFPTTAEDLSKYDTIIAFDPDWTTLAPEQVQILSDWVAVHSGGLIYVAGDVYTGEMSALVNASNADGVSAYKPLLDMLPVYLTLGGFDVVSAISSDQGWPIEFTKDGDQAEFLQLEEDPSLSKQVWKDFPGVFRCYPTAGTKSTATVYANFSDPRFVSQYGQPVLIATQFFGAGRVMYFGSGEFWRMRSINDEYFDRFWIKSIRDVSQGRMKQGNQRLLLMPERRTYYPGQTVRVRARVFDRQLNPLSIDEIDFRVFEPDGKEILPARKLYRDPNRPGEYAGDFRVRKQGGHRIELPDPEAVEGTVLGESEIAEIEVTVPRLESDNTQQDSKLLRDLVADTGGAYLTAGQADVSIAKLFENVGEEFQIDVSSQPLWDKAWVMYLMIGLLSIEWLTRKLLKLA